jgi:hypothetical protein
VHILAIILPETHLANLVTAALLKSPVTTAWASVWTSASQSTHVEELPLPHRRHGRTRRTEDQPHPLSQVQACGSCKRDPAANEPWCGLALQPTAGACLMRQPILGKGGFTELDLHGRWQTDEKDYVRSVRRYTDEIGNSLGPRPKIGCVNPVYSNGLAVQFASINGAPYETSFACESWHPKSPSYPSCRGGS